MSTFVPGEMDITEQKKTFDGFIKAGVRLGIFATFLLIVTAIFGA